MRIANTGDWAALFVWLEDGRAVTARGSAFFERNYFTLFPGEASSVRVDWIGVPAAERQILVKGWNTESYRFSDGDQCILTASQFALERNDHGNAED